MSRVLDVLIVEDNPGDVKLIRDGIKQARLGIHINVRVAGDGEEALHALIDEGYRPDIILLDLGLPKIDGSTVLERVRAHGVELKSTPVIVFSSSQHGIQDVLASGASAYIVKPSTLGSTSKRLSVLRFYG